MKTKFSGILTLLLAFVVQFTFAQERTISGKISDETGPLPGVSILIDGTTRGTETDFDGNYSLNASTDDVLRFSFIGMSTITRTIGVQNVINITMVAEENTLDEVILSGVAGPTSKKELSVSVATVSSKELEQVPLSSAASALQGKVAGVSVTNLGRPGQGSTIILRGAANFYGSQAPLVIMDGVYVEGGLADINVDDINTFEIVKGASASSLYGSRAGNGVIVITSKRGSLGRTQVNIRTEVGFSEINNFIDTNQSHGYELASDWEQYQGQYTKYDGVTYGPDYRSVYAASGPDAVLGSRIESADGYSDNPYGVYNNFQDDFFKKGLNTTTYASVMSGGEKANVFFSYENMTVDGILAETDGYARNSYRLNADFYIADWVTFKTSNNFIALNDNNPGGTTDIYRLVSRLAPDANVHALNPDGQPYYFKPDPWENEIDNPLYQLYVQDAKAKQQRFLGSYNVNFKLSEHFNVDLEYAFENDSYRYTDNEKYETYNDSGDDIGFGYTKGSLYKNSYLQLAQKAQATLNYLQYFGDLKVNAKFSYLAEDREYEQYSATGQNYLYSGLPSMDNFKNEDVRSSSDQQSERAQNYFAIAGLVFKSRYILDALYRRDGSSLFGENNRWNDYYRVSGAWRIITEENQFPGIQEFKISAAMGTAGQRPGYYWQYEQTGLSNGSLSTNRIKGNPDLRPSLTTEMELALFTQFLDIFTFEFAYSHQTSEDQFMLVNLFAPANAGKNRQWQNVGDMESDTYEFTLNTKIFNNEKFRWDLGINFTTTESIITTLNAPEQIVGPGDGEMFMLKEDTEFGSMFGRSFVTDLNTMENQLPAGMSISDYSVNSDGIVVETATIGTQDETAIIEVDEKGVAVFDQIGNQNADFRLGLRSNMTFGNFGFYMLWDWKSGGDIYNKNGQWTTISERNAIVDQTGKADSEKKTRKYYGSLYDVNQNNAYWVEDGSFVKLREASISYTITSDKFRNLIDEIRLSIIGKNILTFTDYTGWDPEVARYDGDTQQYFSVDYGVYPTNTEYSFSFLIKF